MPIPAGSDDPDVATVRLLIADTAEDPLLSDADLEALLELEDGNVRLAAASALISISISELLVAKKISTQNLSVDGPAVARELREQAAVLRSQGTEVAEAETADAVLPLWSFPSAPDWGDSYL